MNMPHLVKYKLIGRSRKRCQRSAPVIKPYIGNITD